MAAVSASLKMASASAYVKDEQGIFGVKTHVLRYWKLHNGLRYIF